MRELLPFFPDDEDREELVCMQYLQLGDLQNEKALFGKSGELRTCAAYSPP